MLNHFHLKRQTLLTTPPSDKENQRNRQFEGKRVVDARKAGPGGEPREERNNQRNTEVDLQLKDHSQWGMQCWTCRSNLFIITVPT